MYEYTQNELLRLISSRNHMALSRIIRQQPNLENYILNLCIGDKSFISKVRNGAFSTSLMLRTLSYKHIPATHNPIYGTLPDKWMFHRVLVSSDQWEKMHDGIPCFCEYLRLDVRLYTDAMKYIKEIY